MRELASCEAPISGEHLISESVIEVLRGDGDFTVSGLPWLEAGEIKKLAPKNLTANCLCTKHNSALSPIDNAAALFFSALRECMEAKTAPNPYLLSGHDVERWLLKTLKAMAVSGNLARGREKLPGAFQRDIDIIRMLDDHLAWPEASGLYFNAFRISNDEPHAVLDPNLRAEMDLVIAFSACPQGILPINGKAGKPVEAHFTIVDEHLKDGARA
jgi:hypothetical protein